MPNLPWGQILSHVIGSRAAVDKIELPVHYYSSVKQAISELESWTVVFQKFSLDKPQSWLTTGTRLIQKVSVPETEVDVPTRNIISRFADKMRLVKIDQVNVLPYYQDVINKNIGKARILFKGDAGVLKMLPLKDSEDLFFYELSDPEFLNGREFNYIPLLPDFADQPERRHRINSAVADLYWEGKRVVKLSMGSDFLDCMKVPFPDREYEGVLVELYESLKLYKARGIRRSLLFQGPPGTGKSTLALNLAKALSKRTLILTHQTLNWCGDEDWEYLVSMLQPEMILVDDIDRIAKNLQNKLFLFEENCCEVPLIVLTSNHWDWLPDAFKRPGRIDQIVEMETPPRSVRLQVVQKIAELEGVRIPEDRLDVLEEIHSEYTGAYIVELVRRAKAEGWDYKIPSYDLTFEKLSTDLKAKWNREYGAPTPDDLEIEF